jgi:Na+/glutamate symporter
MSRTGPGFPWWALAGFCLGLIVGFGTGYAFADHWRLPDWEGRLLVATICGGFGALGGVVIGGIRDVLAYFHHRFEAADGPGADYRDDPFRQLPPAPPFAR